MKLNEKIRILRKARGLSQEELGFELNNASDFGVSRQSISDWENGRSEPKLENIKLLAKALNVSCDTLLDDEIELNNEGNIITEKESNIDNFSYRRTIKTLHYEYKSKKTIGNIPLIHINLGIGFYKAKGIIAIGNISIGLISIGLISIGLLSLGLLAIGLLALGCLSIGLVMAIGAISVGFFGIGAISIGYLSLGALSIGRYAIGALAIAKDIGLGAKAYGDVYFESINNTFEYTKEEIKEIIETNLPSTSNFIKNIFVLFGL